MTKFGRSQRLTCLRFWEITTTNIGTVLQNNDQDKIIQNQQSKEGKRSCSAHVHQTPIRKPKVRHLRVLFQLPVCVRIPSWAEKNSAQLAWGGPKDGHCRDAFLQFPVGCPRPPGWWYTYPSEKIKVSWDDYCIPNIWEKMFQTTNQKIL